MANRNTDCPKHFLIPLVHERLCERPDAVVRREFHE